jgi:hypothetical protein
MYASGITYTSVSSVSSSAGSATARNGLSIDGTGAVVLGQDIGALGDPAQLLNDREIPMEASVIDFVMVGPPRLVFQIGNLNGGAGMEVPTSWFSNDSSNWSMWQPANFGISYAPFGLGERFFSGYSLYPGVNLPVTARPNMVGMFWGYNTQYTQGRFNAFEAAFRYATETFFIIGTEPVFELHTPEMTTVGGTIFRLDSTYVSRNTGIGMRQLVIDNMQWYSTGFNPSGGAFYALLEYNATSDLAAMAFHCQNPGGVAAIGFNNNTTGAIGSITDQDGLMDINSTVDIDLRSPRVIMDATSYNNIVSPVVCSAVNTDSPLGDAQVDIQTVLMGFRPPKMTTAQKNAIAITGGPGLVVFDTTLGKLCVFGNGLTWETVTSV